MSSAVEVKVAPPALGRFVAMVSVAGFFVISHSVAALPTTPNPAEWASLGVLAMLAGFFPLRMPGVPVHVSISDTFFITSAMLYGPAPAVVAIAIDSFTISWRRRHSSTRILFNTTCPALALWCASHAFFLMSGTGPLAYAPDVTASTFALPLGVLACLYFLVNSGLTATAVGLERSDSPLKLWRDHLAMLSLSHTAAASASFFLVIAVRLIGVLALFAVLPLLAIFHLGMRSWLGRLADVQRHIAEVDRVHLSTVQALSTAIKAKDGVTSNHILRVQSYALGLARELQITDPSTLRAIQAASLLHDTGKLAVPERILNKPGKLTPAEFEIMKLHVDVGADILSSIDFPYPVVPIVRAHHENWNGSGYPRGLAGEDIPIGARILSVVDCFEALTSERPYHPAMTAEQALSVIVERRGTMYDPTVVDTFVRVHRVIAPENDAPPELQEAVQHISRSVKHETRSATADPTAEPPNELLAVMSLSRIVSGQPSVSDVALQAWSYLQRLVPAASYVFFIPSARGDEIVACFAAGEGAESRKKLRIGMGHRLSGWVAAHQQTIVNSDARLDLGQRTSLRYCLAVPLTTSDALAGVVTLYAVNPFSDEHTRMIEMMAPHLAEMLSKGLRPEETQDAPAEAEPSYGMHDPQFEAGQGAAADGPGRRHLRAVPDARRRS